jgi:hypothetical protein
MSGGSALFGTCVGAMVTRTVAAAATPSPKKQVLDDDLAAMYNAIVHSNRNAGVSDELDLRRRSLGH